MLTPKQAHLLALCSIEGLNWYLLAREAQRPGGLERLLKGELTEKSTHTAEARDILRRHVRELVKRAEDVAAMAAPAFERGVRITTVLDEDYPLNLRVIFNPPPFLFYRGGLRKDEDVKSVAVVGTRQPTPEGLKEARHVSRMLAQRGVTVLSGLAKGIDTAAHTGALAADGRTVAVLGTGILRIYPRENERLAEEIVKRGALVSQFWPSAPPSSYSFPWRNITMSGMGQGTVVVEASATSGAKMQARFALEHGKKVFLLRSLVKTYPWARRYLDRGAVEVASAGEIVERLLPASRLRLRFQERGQLSLQLS